MTSILSESLYVYRVNVLCSNGLLNAYGVATSAAEAEHWTQVAYGDKAEILAVERLGSARFYCGHITRDEDTI
jgi:hypothetical protein